MQRSKNFAPLHPSFYAGPWAWPQWTENPSFREGKQSACPTLSDLAPPADRRCCGRKPVPTLRRYQ